MRIRRELCLASLLLFSAIAIAACVGSSTPGYSTARAIEQYPVEVAKGGWLYVEYGCVRCHGLGGRGGSLLRVAGPSLISPEFKRTFPKEPRFDQALVNMIKNGSIIEDDRAASMPAWNGVLGDAEIRYIVAYIRAGLPELSVPIPRTRTGEELYKAFACVKCHGEPGTGGVRNVEAMTEEHKIIPAVGGPGFRQKFDSPEKLRKVILNGRLIEDSRPGVVYMPAWGRIGTADQIEKVVEYLWMVTEPASQRN